MCVCAQCGSAFAPFSKDSTEKKLRFFVASPREHLRFLKIVKFREKVSKSKQTPTIAIVYKKFRDCCDFCANLRPRNVSRANRRKIERPENNATKWRRNECRENSMEHRSKFVLAAHQTLFTTKTQYFRALYRNLTQFHTFSQKSNKFCTVFPENF